MDKFINQESSIDIIEHNADIMQDSFKDNENKESSKVPSVDNVIMEETKVPKAKAKEQDCKSSKNSQQKLGTKSSKKLKISKANTIQDPKALKISKLRREMYADVQPGLYGG